MSATQDTGFNVCGLIVHVNPQKLDAVTAALASMQGVDLHSVSDNARLVVTAMDTDDLMAIDQMTMINRLDGVVSITLAYHEIERDSEKACCLPEGCGCA